MSCYYTFVERYILWRALSLFAMSVRGAHERGHPSSSYATICHELSNAYVRVLFCAAYSACSACLLLAITVRALYACIALHVYMYIRSLILLLLRGTNLLVCYRAPSCHRRTLNQFHRELTSGQSTLSLINLLWCAAVWLLFIVRNLRV